MAVIEERVIGAAVPPPASVGFRPGSRRRTRLLLGVALSAAAIGGNLLAYTSIDRRTPVLQVVRDVPAGSIIVAEDLRSVDVALDATVRAVAADRLGAVVGQHAKVRLVAGQLVAVETLQAQPLVSPGTAVVAVQVTDGALPAGLRERSQVRLVVFPPRGAEQGYVESVTARVVGLPGGPQGVHGRVSLSVEVDEELADLVAASDDVRVVLLEPGIDPAGGAS